MKCGKSAKEQATGVEEGKTNHFGGIRRSFTDDI